MQAGIKHIAILLALFLGPGITFAQAERYLIREISISGNERTHDYVILRELSFKEGDSVSITEIPGLFRQGKRQLESMGIISEATFNIKALSDSLKQLDIAITVTERWAIYPVPLLELADRNFNVWWKRYDHSLDRLNYGLKLYHLNLTGRNDQAMLKIQGGFSQKYELKYSLPGLHFLPDWGLELKALYARENNIRYKTVDARELFIWTQDDYLLKRLELGMALVYRYRLNHRFKLKFNYYKKKIADAVRLANPNYLGNNALKQTYLSLGVNWLYDNRNNKAFATQGSLFHVNLVRYKHHDDHSLNYWEVSAYANASQKLAQRWVINVRARARKQFNRRILPYTERRAINWGEVFLEGYDYYLLDGEDYALLKLGLYYKLFSTRIFLGSWVPIDSYEHLHIDLFLGALAVGGYVEDPMMNKNNFLRNRLLYAAGPEVKILINSFLLCTAQAAVNHMGKLGLYLRTEVAFTP